MNRAPLVEMLGENAKRFHASKLSAAVEFVELLLREREDQLKKWGTQRDNSLYEWACILTEELGEFVQEVNELGTGRKLDSRPAVEELIQVAAVALAIFQEHFKVKEINDDDKE